MLQVGGGGGGDDVIVDAELQHFAGEGFESGMAEEEDAAVAGEFSEGFYGGFGASLDGFGGGEDGGKGARGKFGDAVEIVGDA